MVPSTGQAVPYVDDLDHSISVNVVQSTDVANCYVSTSPTPPCAKFPLAYVPAYQSHVVVSTHQDIPYANDTIWTSTCRPKIVPVPFCQIKEKI